MSVKAAENGFEAMQRDVSGMKRQVEMLCRAMMKPEGGPTSPVTAHLLAQQTSGGAYNSLVPPSSDS